MVGGHLHHRGPALDTTGDSIAIQYSYYLTLTNADGTDALLVEWSSNGTSGPWTQIERHVTDATGWRTSLISPGDLAAAGVSYSSDTRVRFTANDDGGASIVEAGVDGFQVTTLDCTEGGTTPYCATSPNSAGAPSRGLLRSVPLEPLQPLSSIGEQAREYWEQARA